MVLNKRKNRAADAPTKAVTSSSVEAASFDLLETYIGPTLLAGGTPKPTQQLLKGKELVALYFGAAWSPPCQDFTSTLIRFYKECCNNSSMEIIYVPSDNTKEELDSQISAMPWLVMADNNKKEGVMRKHTLATKLKVFSIPTVVILNVNKGSFVTDLAREEIISLLLRPPPLMDADDDDESKSKTTQENENNNKQLQKRDNSFATMGADLIQQWKEMDPIPIGSENHSALSVVDYFLKNPIIAAIAIAMAMFTPILQRMMENPLLGVAFWLVLKTWTKPRDSNGNQLFSRNEPYMMIEGDNVAETKAEFGNVQKKQC